MERHYGARIYHPLITSIAETGDMLDARLRAGNVGTADGALDVILDVVDRAQKSFCDVAMVRIDAGFPSAALLAGLDARGIDYVSRLVERTLAWLGRCRRLSKDWEKSIASAEAWITIARIRRVTRHLARD